MRSSKSRSRSKTNRPRTLGNIINRVFDSSGPEGKVRGTPQQIIEKYLFLARDAQLSNDRVAAENFLQHAEHYTRMLGEANRELAAEQESRQQYQPQAGNQPQAGGQNGGQASGQNAGQNTGQNGNTNGQRDRDGQRYDNRPDNRSEPRQENRSDQRADTRNEPRQDRDRGEQRRDDRQPDRSDFRGDYRADFNSNRTADPRSQTEDVIDLSGDGDVGLVETPEAAEHIERRTSEPRKAPPKSAPQAKPEAPAAAEPSAAEPSAVQAEPKPRSSGTRRPRGPKKPVESSDTAAETPDGTPREAAE